MSGLCMKLILKDREVETWNLVLSEFRQIRKSRKFRKSAISGEFEAALLDVQSLDGSCLFPGWSNISSIATRE